MKRMLLGVLVCLMICACENRQPANSVPATATPSATSTNSFQATSVNTPYPIWTPAWTPVITATPIDFVSSSKTLNEIIGDIYQIPPSCNYPDTEEQQKPDFIDITKQVADINDLFTTEIADSLRKSYRAYLVEEQAPEKCSSCYRSRVYVMNLSTRQIYRIDWNGYFPGRFLLRMIWIGDKILVFKQSLSPHTGEIIAVDMEKHDFVYHIIRSEYCK